MCLELLLTVGNSAKLQGSKDLAVVDGAVGDLIVIPDNRDQVRDAAGLVV